MKILNSVYSRILLSGCDRVTSCFQNFSYIRKKNKLIGGVICHLIFFCACIGKVYKSTCHPVTELTLKTEIENEIILLLLIFCM